MNVTSIFSDLNWAMISKPEFGNFNSVLLKFKWATLSDPYTWNRTNIAWVATAVVGLLTLKSILFTTRRFVKDKYPPGPPALPILGNLHQLSLDAWIPLSVCVCSLLFYFLFYFKITHYISDTVRNGSTNMVIH